MLMLMQMGQVSQTFFLGLSICEVSRFLRQHFWSHNWGRFSRFLIVQVHNFEITRFNADPNVELPVKVLMFRLLSQFIDHDITHTPNYAEESCCTSKGGTLSDRENSDKNLSPFFKQNNFRFRKLLLHISS